MQKRITEIVEICEHAADVVELVSGRLAFRKFDWVRRIPIRNLSDNFRGIVRVEKLKLVYEISGRFSKALAGALLLAVFARHVARTRHELEAIYTSQEAWGAKSSKLCCHASALLSNAVAHDTADLVRQALIVGKEARFLTLLATGGDLTHPTTTELALDFTYARLDTFVDQFFDGDHFYTCIRLRFLR